MAIDTERSFRAQPMDAVVSAAATDRAGAIDGRDFREPAGDPTGRRPMMTARWHGERLGACTDCRRFGRGTAQARSEPTRSHEVEGNLATTAGTCAVMGTASTMASIAEALGMILPGTAAIRRFDADRLRAGEATGRAAMQLAAAAGAHPRPYRHPRWGRERAAAC